MARTKKTVSHFQIDKNREYGDIEHMRVDPKAYERFKRPAYPRYDVIGFMKTKGHDTGRVIGDGQKDS